MRKICCIKVFKLRKIFFKLGRWNNFLTFISQLLKKLVFNKEDGLKQFPTYEVLLGLMYFIKASSELTFTGQQPCLLFAESLLKKFFLLYIAYDSQQIFMELIKSVVGTIPFASPFDWF